MSLNFNEFEQVLDLEIKALLKAALAPSDSTSSLLVEIPTSDKIDLSVQDLADLVARTSNNYQRACRFAGFARAEMKIAEQKYKTTFKRGLKTGTNRETREANAAEISADAGDKMAQLQALVELAEYQENACRNASETARKLFDKVKEIEIGQKREDVGSFYESSYGDF